MVPLIGKTGLRMRLAHLSHQHMLGLKGFHISYNFIRNCQLLRDISSLEKNVYSITIVGHSLGGALAANSAFDILHNGSAYGNPRKVELITFGAPAVGNQAFVDRFHQLTATKTGSLPPYCFVNHFDPVPYSIKFKKRCGCCSSQFPNGQNFSHQSGRSFQPNTPVILDDKSIGAARTTCN